MPVSTAAKISALSANFHSQRRLAELLGVSPAQITRWRMGQGIDELNARRVDLLELVMSSLLRLYSPEAAELWLQGANPHLVEALAPFRATGRLSASMLVREGQPLALTRLELDDHGGLVDLDSPQVLIDVGLRPSQVATGARTVTQAYAERIFDEHPHALGLRWWSTIEASFTNLTLYDRAVPHMRFIEATRLTVEHQAVREAAAVLGLMARER